MERFVLGFSDQQLVTGLAILLVAFTRIPSTNGHISYYHFKLVTDLAWFASNTHQTTLLVLRKYLRAHLALSLPRAIGMLVMGCCLLSATFIVAGDDKGVLSCPVECVLSDTKRSKFRGGALLSSFLLLFWGYSVALIPLFEWSWSFWLLVEKSISGVYRRLSPRPRLPFHLLSSSAKLWRAIYISGGLYGQLVGVMLTPIACAVFNVFYFGVGLFSLILDRSQGQALMKGQNEDQFDFGQLVPLLLMALPFLSAIEAYYGTCPRK